MIRGEVSPRLEPVVRLQVRTLDGHTDSTAFVIDTGFSGYLTMSVSHIAALQAQYRGAAEYLLADGTLVRFPVYTVTVLWEGRERTVNALASDGGEPIGMRMLEGSRFTMDVIDGGEVLVEPRA